MKTGIIEILLIALCIFWLINANRKRRVLQKMEDAVDRKQNTPAKQKKTPGENIDQYRDAEDVDYEEVK